ncbi:hypothetical protein AA0472_1850 [Acetobacter estunensis NRIC 0472]|nr:hypothetical protein AA0472_1850 [Acetobacter estunensis NRIC 0472]
MVVDTPESMDMDFDHPVSLHQEPSSNSPTFAPVAEIIAVAEPPETQNGFVKTMNFAFRPGWIETKWLKPYTAIHPGKTCTPSVMNDGKLGFDFRRR